MGLPDVNLRGRVQIYFECGQACNRGHDCVLSMILVSGTLAKLFRHERRVCGRGLYGSWEKSRHSRKMWSLPLRRCFRKALLDE